MDKELLHYEIERRIGAGGMGEVFIAQDKKLNRKVALKFLHRNRSEAAGARERLVREAQAASRLIHPNICTVFAVETVEDGDFLVMEYIEGKSLHELTLAGDLPLNDILKLLAQVADGLAAAHAAGVVHRDIKPANIMVTPDGVAKVMDFGLSLIEDYARLTKTGHTVGTVSYMSPEQARGKALDRRSDIFSLGTVLYEQVAGVVPFRCAEPNPFAVIKEILESDPDPLVKWKSDTPDEVQAIVDSCLQKDAELRCSSMEDLADSMREVLKARGVESMPSAPRPSAATTRFMPTESERTGPPVGLLLGGVGILAVATAAFLFNGGGPEKPPEPPAEKAPTQLAGLALGDRTRLQFRPPGEIRSPALAPDGGRVAYTAPDADGVRQVWVQAVESQEPLQVTREKKDCAYPSWSTRGDALLFERVERVISWFPPRHETSVWSVPSTGGAARRLISNAGSPSWSRDGNTIAFERRGEIWLADADGGNARLVPGPSGGDLQARRHPRISPAGDRIAYFSARLGPAGDYMVIDIAGGEPRKVTDDMAVGGQCAWTADGARIVFASSRSGALTLWSVEVDGGEPEPLTTSGGDDDVPSFSADGGRMAYGMAQTTFRLRTLDLATGESSTLIEFPTPLFFPAFSLDGESIALCAIDEDGCHLYSVARDGRSQRRQVTRETGAIDLLPRWSAEGDLLFYRWTPEGQGLMKTAAEGGEIATVREGWGVYSEVYAHLSPDGDRVVYFRQDGSGMRTIIEEIDSEKPVVLPQPMVGACWSPDGSRLAGFDLLGSIVVTNEKGEDARRVAHDVTQDCCARWSPDGKEILFLRFSDKGASLHAVPAAGGEERKIADLGAMVPRGPTIDVSSRGEVIWVERIEARRQVWITDVK
ncbi:MAG: protein kinase domain-containing protein [Planctomycetota bacterium]|jgi:Tol biopolymer transport system component